MLDCSSLLDIPTGNISYSFEPTPLPHFLWGPNSSWDMLNHFEERQKKYIAFYKGSHFPNSLEPYQVSMRPWSHHNLLITPAVLACKPGKRNVREIFIYLITLALSIHLWTLKSELHVNSCLRIRVFQYAMCRQWSMTHDQLLATTEQGKQRCLHR